MEKRTSKMLLTVSNETIVKFNFLKEKLCIRKNSDLFERLINDAYETQCNDNQSDSCNNEQQLSELKSQMQKIITILNDNNAMIYQDRDGINTLLHFYEVQENLYRSADKRIADGMPHEVLKKAHQNYQDLIHHRSLDKGAKALRKNDEADK